MVKSEFKELLEEVVRKVIREEIRDILVEAVGVVEEGKDYNSIDPGFYKPVPPLSQLNTATGKSINPIQAILQETVLSAADRANIGQVGAVAASPFSSTGPVTEASDLTNSVLPPFPGIG